MDPLAIGILVDQFVEMSEHFARTAEAGGGAPVLMVVGNALMVIAFAVFGLLTAGAVVDLAVGD